MGDEIVLPMEFTMPSDLGRCPKCRAEDWSIAFVGGWCGMTMCMDTFGMEHLHAGCDVCSYVFPMWCADTHPDDAERCTPRPKPEVVG